MKNFEILQFCGLWGMFWPLKSLILNQGSKFEKKVHLTRLFESISESTNFPVYNLVFIATSAAFLALRALKLKKIHICQ